MASIFYVIEGMDGAGKGEMVKLLHNFLFSFDRRIQVLTTREPTYGRHGLKIRAMLAHDQDAKSNAPLLLELFIKDREEHLAKTVIPFLDAATDEQSNIVIADRYYHSTIAFQGSQGLDLATLIEKNRHFKKPTMTFLLDLDPTIALQRMKNRPKEKFEDPSFMATLRENFLKLATMLDEKIVLIDAAKPKVDVFSQIKKEVLKDLRGPKL